MKHPISEAVLFLLLGAIINVAVAWGCAAWSPIQNDSAAQAAMPWDERQRWVLLIQNHGFGFLRMKVHSYYMVQLSTHRVWLRPDWSRVGEQARLKQSDDREHLTTCTEEYAAGWPCLAAHAQRLMQRDRANNVYVEGSFLESVDGAMDLAAPKPYGTLSHDRVLPFFPIWPGFAINTIFYAAILWLPFAAVGASRRRRRIRRGLCPKCAYDLRGTTSQTCPECGKVVKP